MDDYITTRQAAEKWGVTLRCVQAYLKNSRINGAVRFGRDWMIPRNTERPSDLRIKSGRYINISKKKNDEETDSIKKSEH